MARAALAATGVVAAILASSSGEARTVDCVADEVVSFVAAFSPPESGLRVAELPGIVTAPPGDSLPVTGSTSTASLGRGGWILLRFTDNVIVDGPGPDFIVFENAFFRSSVPSDPAQPYSVFAEPASVAVSDDGVSFVEFPYDPSALQHVGQDATPSSALPLLAGLAGITPTFTGNWTVPDDPAVWDPAGPGGVSGAGGDAFDLADVGLSRARYVLIADLGLPTGFAGAGEGFDLDAVVALNALPTPPELGPPPAAPDTDGDGLPDSEETIVHGSDPMLADTDGDGESDGREVARCRSPLSSSLLPYIASEPDVWMDLLPTGSSVRWSFVSSSAWYDVARGTLGPAAGGPPAGAVCIEDNSFNVTSADHLDGQDPAPGTVFLYVVRPRGSAHYGLGSDGAPRILASGDCPP
ncbi:MAG TPA: hypothetical protein VJV23_09340 [Candidatus Polarisedimenticolia bacterium]|nr:hypothetical protein [Candidatus Polarisedimenticolia bacterium]